MYFAFFVQLRPCILPYLSNILCRQYNTYLLNLSSQDVKKVKFKIKFYFSPRTLNCIKKNIADNISSDCVELKWN